LYLEMDKAQARSNINVFNINTHTYMVYKCFLIGKFLGIG